MLARIVIHPEANWLYTLDREEPANCHASAAAAASSRLSVHVEPAGSVLHGDASSASYGHGLCAHGTMLWTRCLRMDETESACCLRFGWREQPRCLNNGELPQVGCKLTARVNDALLSPTDPTGERNWRHCVFDLVVFLSPNRTGMCCWPVGAAGERTRERAHPAAVACVDSGFAG